MDTDINSHADETAMESYASISLDDLSRFLLVSNVLFPRMREPVSHSFQTIYPPSCEGSKHLPRFEESKHPPQCLQMLFKVQYIYQITKNIYFLSPSGIEPTTDVLCHNISIALQPYYLRIVNTESCMRNKNTQSFIHASYQYDNGYCFSLYSNYTQIR